MNNDSLGNDSINSLIVKFSVPSIIAMVVNAIYNIVDRIFIGEFVGETALASLIVVFPIMMILFAVLILTGLGGANLISISLGRGSKEDANKYFTSMIVLSLVFSIITAFFIFMFMENILTYLGAKGEVLEYGLTYLGIYLYFTPFSALSFALSSSVRAEGFPKLSMNALIVSALTNIVLDYIFIKYFHMGVAGGALATGIGQTVGVIIFLSHYVRKKGILSFDFKNIIPKAKTIQEIVVIGTPAFFTNLGISVSSMFLNSSLNLYGGVEAVTAMSAINSLFTIIIMPINGIQGGVSPIIGYNHGAKKRSRVKETLAKALIIGISFSCIAFVLIQGAPKLLLSLFIDSGSNTINGAVIGLRLFMLCLPLLSVSVMSIGYFQATQKPKVAIVLGLLRQFILLIPLLYFLPKEFGLIGVWASVPISDAIAIVISALMIAIDFKQNKEKDTPSEVKEYIKYVDAN